MAKQKDNLVLNELFNSEEFPKDFKYTKSDFLFVLLSMLDFTLAESKRLSTQSKEYPFLDLSVEANKQRWKRTNVSDSTAGSTTMNSEKIIVLGTYFRPIFNKYIKEFVVNHADIFDFVSRKDYDDLKKCITSGSELLDDDLTLEEMKRILVKNIRLLNGDSEQVKDLTQFLKLYFDKFLKDSGDENDTDKTIIMTYPKKEGICPNCNREIDVLYTARFECPYCQTWLDLRKENKMY